MATNYSRPRSFNANSDWDSDSDATVIGDEEDDMALIDSYTHNGMILRSRKSVELRPEEGKSCGNFLRITSILKSHSSGDIVLNGHVYCRNSYVENMLEKNLNEVTWIQAYDPNDDRDLYHQSIRSAKLEDIVQFRQLFMTNRLFPTGSYRDDTDSTGKSITWLRNHARLVCRWKWLILARRDGSLEPLSEAECTPGYGIDSQILRHNFRGYTERGGACSHWLEGEKDFDNREKGRAGHSRLYGSRDLTPSYEKRYTLGDSFCGAGGASRGAKSAGLRVDWGFDNNEAAIRSYLRNFYNTRCEAIAAHEFITIIEGDFKVDVLHISPSCVIFSPIYRIHIPHGGGRNHEINQASFFVMEQLLIKCKPRVVTLEETYGLMDNDNLPFFQAMVQMFTRLGFSIRWRVIDLRTFGLPQPRKRLFIIASCPGETLPEFPKPTHCDAPSVNSNPGLRRYTTITDAISQIPNGFSFHNPDQVPRRSGLPYSGNQPLRNTITCSSGADLHPSGTRTFTLREVACLQGVPLEHEFGPTGVRKQIGNMVPPIVAQAIFDKIVRTLRVSDGV